MWLEFIWIPIIVLVLGLGIIVFRRPKPRMLPDEEHINWQFEVYEWLFENFPKYGSPASGKIFTPSDEDFPVTQVDGDARVREIFKITRSHARMSEAPCRLISQGNQNALINIPGITTHLSGAAGTFSRRGNDIPTITYDPSLIDRPEALIATFAHELSHLLIDTARHSPPGGPEMDEPATDLCAVYLGFGIFLANSAFSFHQDNTRWSVYRQGYLSQPSLAVALAILVLTLDLPTEEIDPYLKTNPKSYFRQALERLPQEHSIQLARLRFLHNRSILSKEMRNLLVMRSPHGDRN